MTEALRLALRIFAAAPLVLKVRGLGGQRWKRNVAKGARIGPWLQANYEVIDKKEWQGGGACLYMVGASDGGIRYVGISRNGLKHRWRTSPAYDAVTMQRLPQNQLFHSQCWKHLELEANSTPGITYEIRSISAGALVTLLEVLGPPLSAFTLLRDDGESVVAGIERWICNHRSPEIARWNVSMTG